MKKENKYELIKFEDGDFSLDVNVSPSEDTVWLTQAQIAELYNVNRQAITKHISNIYDSCELESSTCSILELVQIEGTRQIKRKIKLYNLDMILSIGYRVNSKRGIQFRRWANSILKQYLLNGQVINGNRCLAHSDNIIKLSNSIEVINNSLSKRIDNLETKLDKITSTEYFKNKVFYNGELFEGYTFIKNLFYRARNRIIIIDAYLDYSVLEMLNDITIPITIYIYPSSPITNREIQLFQNNHTLNVIRTNSYHDRFIVIDEELYNVGSSIKDIGKKISHISKLDSIDVDQLLSRYI